MVKPHHRTDLLDAREVARKLGISLAALDRALVDRAIPLPSTGYVVGLELWSRDEIREVLARRSAPNFFMRY